MFSTFAVTLLWMAAVQAFPASTLFARLGVAKPLMQNQVDGYNIYTWMAKLPYCGAVLTPSMDCGVACTNLAHDFTLELHGGDGDKEQYYLVGYSKSLNSVVTAYQGTNTSQMMALATDAHLDKGPLDSSLFPKIPKGIEVHKGFQKEHAKAALEIFSAVESAMSKYKTQSVTIVGHSLGAALATLNGVFLRGRLPSSTTIKIVTYGQPRVGNQAFADYVDANTPLTRITNMKDPIPIVPGQKLGYRHPSGEIHITDGGPWSLCKGQEDESSQCIDGEVPSVFKSVESDHDGPYNGIMLGRCGE